MRTRSYLSTIGLCAIGMSCGDDGTANGAGQLNIVAAAEATITEGLPVASAGEDEGSEDYAVTFDKYLATIGNVRIARSRDSESHNLERSFVVDMTQVPGAGLTLGSLGDVPAGTWDKVSFETPRANAASEAKGSVAAADLQTMIDEGLTYWIAGQVERSAAEGGPISFDLKVAVPTRFQDCSFEEEAGLSVVEGRSSSATFTLHGDHLFFNAFPAAGEESIKRMAGWMFSADADQDGTVTVEDLAQLDASDIFSSADGYNFTGSPLKSIETALDYVRAQLATQGHFRGEGECVPELLE